MTVINDQKGEVTSSLCTVYDSQRKETTPPPSPAQDAPEAPSARSQALGLAMLDRGLRKLRRRNTCPEAPSRNEEKSELAKKIKVTRKIKSPLTTHDKENDSFFFFFFPENQTRVKEKPVQRSAVSTVGAVVSQPAFARARVCTRRGRGARGPRFPSLAGFHLGPCSFVEIPEHKQPMCETHSPPSSWAESRLGGAAWASRSRSSGCPGVPAADWPPTSVENILVPRFFVGKSAGRCWLDHTQSEANGTQQNRLRARVSEARNFQREPHVLSDTS